MLHYSAIYNVIERTDHKGNKLPFSFMFVKMKTGDIIVAENCICTSSHHRPRTINVKFKDSNEFRKIRTCSIIELNGVEVYV